MLSDRLRKLEAAGVVRRSLGEVGEGVAYELTERGLALAPVMAEIRRWGADELLADTDCRSFDLAYELPAALELDETYEWRIDGRPITSTIKDQILTQATGPADDPALIVETSTDFMRRWAAGETNWDSDRANGKVTVTGREAAWNRMLVATNYPGRPPGLAEQLIAAQNDPRSPAT